MTAETTSYKVSRPTGYGLTRNTATDGEIWFHGPVRTPDGVVIVYSDPRSTNLALIRDGREYSRRINRGHGHAYLVTLAARFAKEIADAHR